MFWLAVLARHLAPVEQSHLKEKKQVGVSGFWSRFSFARIRIRGKMNVSNNNKPEITEKGTEVLLLLRSRYSSLGKVTAE